MMSAILNSTILDSAMLNKKTSLIHSDSNWWWQPSLICHVRYRNCHLGFIHLVIFSQIHSKHSHSTLSLTQTNSIWLKTHSFLPNLIMAAILNSGILNFAILDSAILVFPLKLTHTWPRLVSTICTLKNLTHSFWLSLIMAAILNSAMLDSETAILDLDTLLSSLRYTQNTLTPLWLWLKLIQSDDVSHLEFYHLGFSYVEQKNFTHLFRLKLMMAAIFNLPC